MNIFIKLFYYKFLIRINIRLNLMKMIIIRLSKFRFNISVEQILKQLQFFIIFIMVNKSNLVGNEILQGIL